jgi:hypothetical protein
VDEFSGVVPANSQASNKDLCGIISLMVSTVSKHSPQHRSYSSSKVWNFTNNLSNHYVHAANVPAFFVLFFVLFLYLLFFLISYQHCKRLIYTSCRTGIFIFKPVLGRVVLTFPWTCWFRNYRCWDRLQFF